MIFRSTYNRPIFLIGNGVRTADAVELLHDIARKTHIPILTTMVGVDIAQDDLHIGFIGTHGNRVANIILNECDLIISIGARLGIRQVGRDKMIFAPKSDLIRVDIDEFELSRKIKDNERQYRMDAKDFLFQLLNENIQDYSEWNEKCRKAKVFLEGFDITEGNEAVRVISDLLPANPIVTVDVGQNQCWCAQSLVLKGYEGRILLGGGYGTMGCGLPYAIGASIASKNGKVFCLCGDGGFQMNIQELETVRRENLPIKIIILNNRVLGKISETQRNDLDGRFANTTESGGYTVPDFEKISLAYGIKACTLNSYHELYNKKKWFEDDEPCLMNIMLKQDSFLKPKIQFESGEILPKLPNNACDNVIEILNS